MLQFGQQTYYSFAPNTSPCLMMPPQTVKNPNGLSEADMRKLLPTHHISWIVIRAMNGISKPSYKEVKLEFPIQ